MNKKERSAYMASLGAKGGSSTKNKYGLEHYKTLGKKGQAALLENLDKKPKEE